MHFLAKTTNPKKKKKIDSTTMESMVPPGFRFHPTDEELVGYYLKKKVASQKIDLDVIRDVDLYRIEPWDLEERCKMGKEEQKEWYFFSHKDKKYPTGTRTNRATLSGFWKATGRDKGVYEKGKLIGMRKTLVFYKGRAPNGLKTDWILHEYRLEYESNRGLPQEEGWVVCRAFKKKTTMQSKNIDGWAESTFMFEETNGVSSMIDPIFVSRQSQNPSLFFPNNMICKQEMESKASTSYITNSFSVDNYSHLPQLESPTQLPFLSKTPCTRSSMSLLFSNNFNNDDNGENVTDWQTLDKFVASQLSQDMEQVGNNHHQNQGVLNINDDDHEEFSNSEMEDFWQSHGSEGRENEMNMIQGSDLMSEFLSSSSGNGVCIFN